VLPFRQAWRGAVGIGIGIGVGIGIDADMNREQTGNLQVELSALGLPATACFIRSL